jgi:biopolymer transport protein ExbD
MRFERFRHQEESPTIPLTSMIDVLFLMIIFLVMVANFDAIQGVTLPEAQGTATGDRELVSVVLRADGALLLDGEALPPEETIARLKAHHPRSVLLLPDRRTEVGTLFRWYDRLGRELRVPVQVGVRQPAPP